MRFYVYDASGKLRFQSRNWPMTRSAMDLVISEADRQVLLENCPRLEILPEEGRGNQ